MGSVATEWTIVLVTGAFIDPHTYLGISKADVILTFFGSNAAWDNNPDNYKNALSKWIDETRTKKYNGENAPTIVLFSPIAQEDLSSANYPTGEKLAEQNARLEKITAITAAVADEKKCDYIDLFAISKTLYAKSKKPLTLNGIFLTQEGNQHLAQHILRHYLIRTLQRSTRTWNSSEKRL